MEGGERDLLGLLGVDRSGHPLAHLLCRLVRESHRKDGCGIDSLGNKPGDAGRKHTRLSGSRPGKDEHRAIGVGGRPELLGIQVKESEAGHGKERMKEEFCGLIRKI